MKVTIEAWRVAGRTTITSRLRPKQPLLAPGEKVASAADTEQVDHGEHHKEAERGRKNQVLRLGDIAGHRIGVGLHTVTVHIVLQQELHPSGPEQQTAEESAERLTQVTAHKHAGHGYQQARQAH